MNRYTMSITINNGRNFYDLWKFIVITDETVEFVKHTIEEAKKEFNFESPVELMDYVCDTYDYKWEDFEYDIEIEY